MRPSMGVVGAGKVGSVLAARLRAAGYPVVGVSGRSEASRLRISTLLPGVPVLEPEAVAAAADVLVLSVPDDSLIAVAEELAASGAVRPGQVVLHTSGRHGLDALAALTRLGARPIAFHPAMTFTGTAVDLERGPVFGLTAADADRPLAEELVAALHGVPMWVAESDRALYHAALAHGANHLVTLVAQSMDLLRTAGAADPAAVLRPLLTAALDNVLAYGDAALTGPVVRGDVTTIRAHVDALAASDVDDATVDAYLELARATARRAEADHRLDAATAGTIRQVLDEADWDTMAHIAAGF
ncbi:glycerol-3-phosphate dehydrogenase [Aeromicrobium sp. Root472D3]|nr:glycerol-3-phosphate dehydrogenase [Aeromicrobium sp. Root472D3]